MTPPRNVSALQRALRQIASSNEEAAHLQLIMKANIDLKETREICKQLFAYRKCQAWPPIVEKGEGWDSLYDHAKGMLPVLATVDEAVDWVNDLIGKIDKV